MAREFIHAVPATRTRLAAGTPALQPLHAAGPEGRVAADMPATAAPPVGKVYRGWHPHRSGHTGAMAGASQSADTATSGAM